mmetsp:Transcript_11591/g.17616  ORF Transcript_11591/g.17616 Transcript_11591/m.17616 type:complete len:135 (-) Transcript_11591:302-706(-)
MLRSLLPSAPSTHQPTPQIVTRKALQCKTDETDNDSETSHRKSSFGDDVSTTISDSNSVYSSSSCEDYVTTRVVKCVNCEGAFFPQYSRFEDPNFCSKDCSTCYSWFYKKRSIQHGPKEIPANGAGWRGVNVRE